MDCSDGLSGPDSFSFLIILFPNVKNKRIIFVSLYTKTVNGIPLCNFVFNLLNLNE